MAVDIFSVRSMLAALEQAKPPRTWILDTFFTSSQTFDTETVDIDIIKGHRRMAPFVNPRLQGKVVERRGYKTRSYKPAYIKPKMVTTAADIFKRDPGQHIYAGNIGPAARAAMQVGLDLAELDTMITRREEWMAAMALTTGTVPVIGEGVDDLVDFLFDATHLPALVGTAQWDDSTNATPLDDLKTWKRLVAKDSGIAPTVCLMGLSALDNFLKCDQVIGTSTGGKTVFNMINVMMGRIDPKLLPNGITYYGTLTEVGLEIYTYEEWYIDDESGIEAEMMPTSKVLLGSPSTRATRMYGAIQDLDATAAVPRFPKSWTEKDPSARFIMLQSAPLPAPLEPDAFLCATVL